MNEMWNMAWFPFLRNRFCFNLFWMLKFLTLDEFECFFFGVYSSNQTCLIWGIVWKVSLLLFDQWPPCRTDWDVIDCNFACPCISDLRRDSLVVLFGHEMPMRIKRKLLIYISRGNQLKCTYPNFLILYGLSDFQAVKVKHNFFYRE